ncbi:36.4 kDa proline-rich protein [Gastrolobium bilobum]|uniref:36.4 kDa proline-rich protein n=1 Tax=Gastrolobium bilobum TaxID=150636 RepID=UPI002AB19E3A|nr:36.4 kDa proline-rich protein [Gastrolobium bilobum]
MESSKIYAYLFICMLFISSATPILGCGYCGKPSKKHKPKTPIVKKPPGTVPPVTVPPILKPPVTLPIPPIVKPPITLPPIVKPPVTLPIPPVTVPPVLNPPSTGGKPCPPPKSPAQATCPIDTLKLGACVDLLGGLVHIGVGDPVVNECCPVLQGLVELEAAVCLCTTLKVKLLNLNIFVPLALQLLVTCGKTPPPGYTCSL